MNEDEIMNETADETQDKSQDEALLDFISEGSENFTEELDSVTDSGVISEGSEDDGFDDSKLEEALQEHQLKSYDLKGACEAMLFVSDEPLGLSVFASMLQASPAEVQEALQELQQRYEDQESGIVLREVAGGWRIFTNPVYHELIEQYVLSWDTRKLSAAALETLAVVAYAQPVTRNAIASVRGVSSDSALHSLVEKGLVKEVGNAETPGNPTLYGTTRTFLEKFGLRTPKDLPDLAQYAPDLETERLIRERLSASREEGYSVAEEVLMGYVPGEEAGGEESSPQEAILNALATSLGVVDKIDFDTLVFDTDDE